MEFECKQRSSAAELKVLKRQRVEIRGETDRVEYHADSAGSQSAQQLPCRYLVGTFDPRTKELVVQEAPVLHMEQTVKNLKLAVVNANASSAKATTAARRDLGETFGTRKAKQAIRTYERGQIDVGTLSSVASFISQEIDEKASQLQTPDAIEKMTQVERPIPPYDAKTDVVEQVYKLQDLITEAELKSLPLALVMAFKKKELAAAKQSHVYPEYVMERLEMAVRQKNEQRVQCLLYVSYLMRFRALNENQLNRQEALAEALVHASTTVQHRLLQLFTESHEGKKPGTVRYKMPSILKDKLTAYICALCLHIDGFQVVPNTLARDMQITPTKLLDCFRQLGCVVETTSVNGVSCRKARLKAPVEFPKPPRRRMMK